MGGKRLAAALTALLTRTTMHVVGVYLLAHRRSCKQSAAVTEFDAAEQVTASLVYGHFKAGQADQRGWSWVWLRIPGWVRLPVRCVWEAQKYIRGTCAATRAAVLLRAAKVCRASMDARQVGVRCPRAVEGV